MLYALLPASDRWHAILGIYTGHSVSTYCNGRWPETEPRQELEDPPQELRCARCEAVRTGEPVVVPLEPDDDEWLDKGSEL
jgi:hypothetical protein